MTKKSEKKTITTKSELAEWAGGQKSNIRSLISAGWTMFDGPTVSRKEDLTGAEKGVRTAYCVLQVELPRPERGLDRDLESLIYQMVTHIKRESEGADRIRFLGPAIHMVSHDGIGSTFTEVEESPGVYELRFRSFYLPVVTR